MNGNSRLGMLRVVEGALLSFLLLGLLGCGAKSSLSGKVTYKNNPLPIGTRIVFLDEKTDRSYQTEVSSDDGGYRIDSLPIGKLLIAVQTSQAANVGGAGGGAGPQRGGVPKGKEKNPMAPPTVGKDMIAPPAGLGDAFNRAGDPKLFVTIPGKYTDPKESGLSVTTKQGKQPFDIIVPES